MEKSTEDNGKVVNTDILEQPSLEVTLIKDQPTDISVATNLASSPLDDINTVVASLANIQLLAETLVKSKLCPLKDPNDAVLAIITGQQYGFKFSTSLNNIININGKAAFSTHLYRAILLSSGVFIEKIYDFEPIYQWALLDDTGAFKKDAKGNAVSTFVGTNAEGIKGFGKIAKIDNITKYKFTRKVKIGEETKELVVYSSFKMSQAQQADLLNKQNWINYPERMLDARALSIGAREIAPDKILGVYSQDELQSE